MRWLAVAASVVLGAGVGLGGFAILRPHLVPSPAQTVVLLDGEALPPTRSLESAVRVLGAELGERTVVLRHAGASDDDDFVYVLMLRELGVRLDEEATVEGAERLVRAARRAGGEVEVAPIFALDEELARAALEACCVPELAREPVSAEIDLARRRKLPDVPGAELDVDAVVAALAAGQWQQGEIALSTREVPAVVRLDDLADLDLGTELSSFETRFANAGNGRGRGGNVELAARLLDGLVLRPGATVSFNDRVGPRTLERGFNYAPEIQGDELTVGIGGGTCQVSSTLHAAALYGGLSIVERKSHSRPSAYTKLGLDATVAYGMVDLKISNPFSFTVVVHAFVPELTKLRIELLGGKVVDRVDYSIGIANVQDFVRRIEVRPNLPPGRMKRHQSGTRGMDVHSVVTLHFLDGRSETLQYFSGYRATPEIYYIAPGVDPSLLPPLPEHAKAVVAKGEAARLALEQSDPYAEPM